MPNPCNNSYQKGADNEISNRIQTKIPGLTRHDTSHHRGLRPLVSPLPVELHGVPSGEDMNADQLDAVLVGVTGEGDRAGFAGLDQFSPFLVSFFQFTQFFS